ncbi:MAG: hypothetical protein AAGJ32_06055 [Pseudomonadota bacterium]
MLDPRSKALASCVDAAIAAGRIDLGLRAYERQTAISARMLAHHFGGNAGIKIAVLEEIEARLRSEVAEALAESGMAPIDVARTFAAPERRELRRLLQIILHGALGEDAAAVEVLADERQRWRDMLGSLIPEEDVEQALFILVGGAVDAMLGDAEGSIGPA